MFTDLISHYQFCKGFVVLMMIVNTTTVSAPILPCIGQMMLAEVWEGGDGSVLYSLPVLIS